MYIYICVYICLFIFFFILCFWFCVAIELAICRVFPFSVSFRGSQRVVFVISVTFSHFLAESGTFDFYRQYKALAWENVKTRTTAFGNTLFLVV